MSITSIIAEAPGSDTAPRAYARFSRRLQAVMIDYMILTIGLVAALVLATASNMNSAARMVGIAAAAAILLYEPFFVSIYGGTIGHTRRNLRVIDDRTGTNVGFAKAFARFSIKLFLGWFSFLSMTTTQRHQALHDLWTNSTVQIRELDAAQPHHFAVARSATAQPGMPGSGRRAAVIAAYAGLSFIVMVLALIIMHFAGFISPSCFNDDACTWAENASVNALILGWIALLAGILYSGWHGRLLGCRRKTSEVTPP